jgi:transcriptional regulator with XRE-family HTH domain
MTGVALRRLRRGLGWTQKQLAEAVGVTRKTVARWERGELGMRSTAERVIRLVAEQHAPAKTKRRS